MASARDLEGELGLRPRPWMTWLLCGSIVLVYLAQLLGVRHGVDRVGMSLAVGPGALASHRYWTLITYAWAHAVPLSPLRVYLGLHIVINLLLLFAVGPLLERVLGTWRYLALYAGGAIAAALVWSWGPLRSQDAMIGASGSIFALFGAAGVLGLQLHRIDFFFFNLPLRLNLRTAVLVLCGMEIVQMSLRGLPQIAHVGHLAGALFGAIFACVILQNHPHSG